MDYKFNFTTEEEKEKLIIDNNNLYLKQISEHLDESFLIFSDEEPPARVPNIEEIVQAQGNKISILESENKVLKLELSITQDAVNELLFNTLNA